MKKFLSVVLTLTMLISMFTTASAATIADYTNGFIPNPMEMPLDVSVLACESGKGGQFSNVVAATVKGSETAIIDYRSTLDMEPIRILFDGDFINAVLSEDGQRTDAAAAAEFSSGKITTKVNVVVDYPASAIITSNLSQAGALVDNNGIFVEKSRNVNQNERRVTVTYVNTNDVTVGKLQSDIETYLADLTFDLPSAIAFSEAGAHKVTVTLSGSTSIAFSSKTQVVNYNGKGSQIVNITKEYDALEHMLVTVPGKVATCFDGGWKEGTICSTHSNGDLYDLNNPGYSCNVLGIHKPVALEKLNHKIGGATLKTKITRVEPTCTTKGMEEHWTCSLCKSDFDSDDDNAPVKPHEDYVIGMKAHTEVPDSGSAATCAKPGYTDGKHCSVCKRVIKPQELIPVSTEHTGIVSIGENKEATCTETGSKAGRKCNDCGKVFESPKVTPATGHKFGDWEIVQAATPSAKGTKKRVCEKDASHVEYADIPVSEHTIHEADPEKDEIVKAPTCTEPGVKKQYCSCGQLVNDNVQIPATGHTLSKVTAIAATCVDTGIVEHYHCEVCGKNYRNIGDTVELNDITQSIDKHNHPEGQTSPLPTIDPTCISVGFTGGEMCRACNRIINTDTNPRITVPYARHKNELVRAVAETCTESGVKEHFHCAVCNKDFDMDGTSVIYESDFIIPAKGHKFGESLADKSNAPVDRFYPGTKTCEYGCGATKNVKVPVDKENCQHKFTETVGSEQHTVSSIVTEVVTPPTCTTEGINKEICSFCDKVTDDNIPVPKLNHDRVYVNRVEPTCLTTGVEAYWQCNSCHGLFHHEDASLSINEPAVLDKTEHQFRIIGNGNNKQCIYCKELVHIKKKNREGNETENVAVSVVSHGHISHSEEDMARATVLEGVAEIPSVITIEEKKEVSPKLDEAIGKDVDDKKYVVDISIEKVTTYLENPTIETEKEEITQTDDFVTFEISIPEEMWKDKNIVDYRVHRLHWNDETKKDEVEILSTVENSLGERIWVDVTNHKVKIRVKKFSEYAVVAHTTKVNPDVDDNLSHGGGSSSVTIKLNANGGTLLNDVKVKRGTKAELPVPTRSGYVFAGWYLDNNFTTPFDADTVINRNYTLYAKWVPVDECRGIEEDNCPCLKFYDLDPTMWYHRGVDYVLNRGMMIGVADTQFAPDWDVTRAMLVTVLWRAEGKPVAANTTFTDLEDGLYYVDAVKWAAANGVVNGYSETVFAPNDAITREQFAAIMYRYAKAKGYDVSVGENTNILSYSDYAEISEYAIPAMQYTAGSGLIKGRTETTLNPKDNTTRAEMATILYRFFTENK